MAHAEREAAVSEETDRDADQNEGSQSSPGRGENVETRSTERPQSNELRHKKAKQDDTLDTIASRTSACVITARMLINCRTSPTTE